MARRPPPLLDMSIGKDDQFDNMGQTYRNEGISVSVNHLRIKGTEVMFSETLSVSDLTIGRRIGQGACSSVCIAQHNITKEQYAVKKFNVYDDWQSESLKKELELLTKCNECDALITLKGVFHQEGEVGMILEYMDRGSLESLLIHRNDLVLSEEVLAAISFQIIWGLGYLHFEKILHRDVKPANVLINSEGHIKLSDFGIAKDLGTMESMSNTAVGTFRYMSLERLLGQHYNASGDIWSVGIMMIELWTKKFPFEYCINTPIELVSELESLDLNSFMLGHDMTDFMREIIKSMLYRNPKDRISSLDLIEGAWFGEFGLTSLEAAQSIVVDWLEHYESVRERNNNKRIYSPNDRKLYHDHDSNSIPRKKNSPPNIESFSPINKNNHRNHHNDEDDIFDDYDDDFEIDNDINNDSDEKVTRQYNDDIKHFTSKK